MGSPPGDCLSADDIAAFIDGNASAGLRDKVEEHIDRCPLCARTMAECVRERRSSEIVEGGAFRVGAHVDSYRIDAILGEGATGVVYEAVDVRLERRVAMKVLRDEKLTRTGPERLLREGKALAQIRHPSVVAVHDVGIANGRPYLVTELVVGRTLGVWLHSAPRSTPAVLSVFAQVARGLAALHKSGLVHRDVKPDNIFVRDDGSATVGDLGLAAWADPAATLEDVASPAPVDPDASVIASMDTSQLTMSGLSVGTLAYVAPEQLAGRPDGRSDQFSLCVSLYEALFGARPYANDVVLRRFAAPVSAPRIPRRPALPRSVRAGLLRGLDIDPDRRLADITGLAEILEGAASRRTRLVTLASLALALLAVVVVVALSSHARPAKSWVARLEAESGDLLPPMVVAKDPGGDVFVHVPEGSGNVWGPGPANGRVTLNADLPADGTYFLWARVRATTAENDSFFVSVGDAQPLMWVMRESNRFVWDAVRGEGGEGPHAFLLKKGRRAITFMQREDGTQLDAVLVTNDRDYVPPGGDATFRVIEFERVTSTPPAQLMTDDDAAHGWYVEFGRPGHTTRLGYWFSARRGTYRAWVRARCSADAVLDFSLNDDPATRVIVHPSPKFAHHPLVGPTGAPWPGVLAEGDHRLVVYLRSGTVDLDHLVLTDDAEFEPSPLVR